MPLGTAVRKRLGRWEVPAANLYRSRFINLDDLSETVASLGPARRILEIGCGDGTHAERLCAAFPEATYTGIDIAPQPGELFKGDRKRASFRSVASSGLIAERPEPFDLVLVVDVVHHVSDGERLPLLRDAAQLVAPGGLAVVKEWERSTGLPHLAAFVADRFVSGDRTVRFMSLDELRLLVADAFRGFDTVMLARIPPRRNNYLVALRKPTD